MAAASLQQHLVRATSHIDSYIHMLFVFEFMVPVGDIES